MNVKMKSKSFSIYLLSAFILYSTTGCGNITGASGPGGGTPSPTPTTTTINATVEQSVSVSTTDGTTYETGYLEYLWFHYNDSYIPPDIIEHTYIKFGLSQVPSGATIQSAYLTIWITTLDAVSLTAVTRVTATWEKMTILATNEPATSGTPADSKYSVLGALSFNITSLVQQWANGSAANYGVVIGHYAPTSAGSNRTRMLDYNDPVDYPRITIKYY